MAIKPPKRKPAAKKKVVAPVEEVEVEEEAELEEEVEVEEEAELEEEVVEETDEVEADDEVEATEPEEEEAGEEAESDENGVVLYENEDDAETLVDSLGNLYDLEGTPLVEEEEVEAEEPVKKKVAPKKKAAAPAKKKAPAKKAPAKKAIVKAEPKVQLFGANKRSSKTFEFDVDYIDPDTKEVQVITLTVPGGLPKEARQRITKDTVISIFHEYLLAIGKTPQSKIETAQIYDAFEKTIESVIFNYSFKFLGAMFRIKDIAERYFIPIAPGRFANMMPDHPRIKFDKKRNIEDIAVPGLKLKNGIPVPRDSKEGKFTPKEKLSKKILADLDAQGEEYKAELEAAAEKKAGKKAPATKKPVVVGKKKPVVKKKVVVKKK